MTNTSKSQDSLVVKVIAVLMALVTAIYFVVAIAQKRWHQAGVAAVILLVAAVVAVMKSRGQRHKR